MQVLVTGGKRGIGKAIAELLSKNHQVFAPNSKELDVCSQESIDNYFAENNIEGQIDILVNNAGVHSKKSFLKHSDEDWQKVFAVNFFAAVKLCNKVIPDMQKKSYGRIINISSISGLEAEGSAAAYSASKSALNSLSQSLAIEFARDNITVNSICPGWVRTEMALKELGENPAEKEALILGSVLQKRWIEPSEIAHMVQYLISDEAKAITGQSMKITAGLDL